jgi:hypothetical protein
MKGGADYFLIYLKANTILLFSNYSTSFLSIFLLVLANKINPRLISMYSR